MPSQHPPATLLRRLAAALYDGLLLLALWMTATFPLLIITGGEAIDGNALWYPLYLVSITGAFHIWFWTHGGQTLGMRAWRLFAVDEQGYGLGPVHAIQRYLLAVPAWLSVIGLLWCWVDRRGRAAHDILSHSNIVCIPKKKDS